MFKSARQAVGTIAIWTRVTTGFIASGRWRNLGGGAAWGGLPAGGVLSPRISSTVSIYRGIALHYPQYWVAHFAGANLPGG